eukprot:UN33947
MFFTISVVVFFWWHGVRYFHGVKLTEGFRTFSWTFWFGQIIALIVEAILFIIGALLFLGSDLSVLANRWNNRPSKSECNGYGNEDQCKENDCSWEADNDGECGRQTKEDFVYDNHECLLTKATMWLF